MPTANPFRPEPKIGDWILAGVIGAAALGALLWGLSHAGAHRELTALFEGPPPAVRDAEPVPLPPITDRGSVATARIPSGGRIVPSCVVNGRSVYGDAACAHVGRARAEAAAGRNVADATDRDTAPVQVSAAVVDSPPVFIPTERSNASPESNEAACKAIRREIFAIDTQFQRGPTASELERLRTRRRDATGRFEDFGCR